MKPSSTRRPQGFSIIAVLFLLVVLAGLGAVIAQLSVTQHLGTLSAQQGRQAHYSARAGVDWVRYRLTVPPTTTTGCADILGQTIDVAGQTATVKSCSATVYDEDGPHTVFVVGIEVVANAAGADQVSRTMQLTVYR